MISGIPVPAKISEYAATSMRLSTKEEIFSAMVVYGFLTYENGYVSIPNKELMDRFNEMMVKVKCWESELYITKEPECKIEVLRQAVK